MLTAVSTVFPEPHSWRPGHSRSIIFNPWLLLLYPVCTAKGVIISVFAKEEWVRESQAARQNVP